VKKHSKKESKQVRTSASKGQAEVTIGIDVGDQYSHFCWLDAEGEIVKRGRVSSTQAGLEREFGGSRLGGSRWRRGRIATG
jgi:transposase